MKTKIRPFINPKVEIKFNSFNPKIKKQLLLLRELIFKTAENIEVVREIEESLKWNEPSYSPIKPKVGSPIRINCLKNSVKFAVYFNCQTNLISTLKEIYPKTFRYLGNRGIVFDPNDSLPLKELEHCISIALTYHVNKAPIHRKL